VDYERKEQILNILRAKQYATVNEICMQLYVSGATVRRDMKELEERRQIRRTRGGAYLVEGISTEDPYAVRERQHVMEKQIIAAQALQYIRDGMTIFLDSSSTVYILVQSMRGFNNLRVITNSLKTALCLSSNKGIEVMCACGKPRAGTCSLVGQSTVDYLRKLNADAAFVSACGFDLEKGTSEASEEEAFIKRTLIDNAKDKYLLCDSSKMGKDFLRKTADLLEFNKVITERQNINSQIEASISDARS
jgi:DeoR/GlpR family transcriptional regulator of sugar metabolism